MGGKRVLWFKNWLLFCFILSFFSLNLGLPTPVLAQDDEFTLEEIVVTGSRIAKNNNESTSPIVTVDEKLFNSSATMAIETQLNKLPQFTPTIDIPTTGGDIQPTARNTPGEATVALRGLGANRSMVLINGRRGTPSNGGMYVDINTIPTAAIQYVEAISGGASATYGADAMAGVVNFIMRDRFEGFQVDAQAGYTQAGDGLEYQISTLLGTNIADDRGNIMMAFSYNKRNDMLQRDRSWYRKLWADTSIGGTQFFSQFSGFVIGADRRNEPFPGACAWGLCPANYPTPEAMNQVIGNGADFTNPDLNYATNANNQVVWYDPSSQQAFTGFGFGRNVVSVEGTVGADIADGFQYIKQDNGMYGTNNIDNYLILPMERYNMYTRGNYEFNDWIGVFMEGYFSKVRTETVQEPAPITGGWAVEIADPMINQDAIPGEIWDLLMSRPNPDAPFIVNALLPFDRVGFTEVYTYNLVTGLEGTIPKIDWSWEAYVMQGEAETSSKMSGFGSLQRINTLMNYGPNFGEGAEITGNQDNPVNPGFGAATAKCTSGFNIFDWASVTDDCWNAVLADIKSKQVMKQTIYEANFQGAIVELPAGELKGALGISRRELDYYFNNDTIVTEGRSFLEQSLGLYPADNTEGYIETDEVYGEVYVPLLRDLPFINQLSLELGGRRSDYNTTGVSYTYKALADWKTTSWLRFRGGYNRAERSPNMAELFLAPEQTFSFGAARGDVCALGNQNSYSANEDVNASWANALELCGQIMELTGGGQADDQFYGVDYREILANGKSAATNPGALGVGYAGAFPHAVGNPNLKPETADTWTVGVVIDSPIESIPALMDWRVSIDYYIIKVEDAIGLQSADVVMQQCLDPQFNPTYDPLSPFCEGFPRVATGGPGNIQTSFFNNGQFETSGIDLSINWSMDLGPGRFGINTVLNYLISKKSTELSGVNPLVDFVGTLGPNENGLNGSSYEWQAMTTFSYNWNKLGVSLRWSWYDSIEPAAAATGPTDYTGLPSYSLFDLSGTYQLLDNLMLRFGVDNLLQKEPPLYFRNTAPAENQLPGGMYSPGIYDTVGRRFYLGARVYF